MKVIKRIGTIVGGILLILVAFLLFLQKEDTIQLLYATNGAPFDASAYDNFQQTLVANVTVRKESLDQLSSRKLQQYDAIYLDEKLQHSEALNKSQEKLMTYVQNGGHLFLENGFASDFPTAFIGASEVKDVPTILELHFEYPPVDVQLQDIQQMFQLFANNFNRHLGMNSMPGFPLGKGLVTSTGTPIVTLNGITLMSLAHSGKGSVLLSSAILPNRYFITGFDLQSGMDPAQGFPNLAKQYNDSLKQLPSTTYFDKKLVPLEPFFNFGFAAANYQLRNEYLAYVSKEKLGYSIKKVLGPYGRPAMAYQNHFEALPAFRDREGIQWAEMLKGYNEIPSFTLVRASYDWGKWNESIIVHLNTGSSEKPQFIGEYPNSFYASGAHLVSGSGPLTIAKYPDYKSLADPIELPYRAYPTFADLNNEGRLDLIAGSADGFVYRYVNLGSKATAYANQPLPTDLKIPDAFDKPQKLLLTNGQPLQTNGYSAPAAYDLNGDGLRDLILGDEQGKVWFAINRGGFTFDPPKPVNAGQKPLQVASYAAPTLGDMNGDGIPDLIVGDGDGKVHLFRGIKGNSLAFGPDEVLFQAPAKFASPVIKDINQDGKPDLIIGSSDGDLQVYTEQGNGWVNQGPLTGDTYNQIGTKALVGGHNSVPLWYDINHDGKDDLIVGQLEFGPPVTIDDPQFPYASQLHEFINYAKENKLELFPHMFVHNYVSSDQEKLELALHHKAFDTLGIPWQNPGTNQHTWRINNIDRIQTLRNENEQQIWYNFGFTPSHTPTEPRLGGEYMWGMPFLLTGANLQQPMLVYTPAPVLRIGGSDSTEDLYQSFVKLNMPINYFEHIEYHFPGNTKDLKQFAQYFDRLRTTNDYNFMTEPQMAQAFLAAKTTTITVGQSWGTYLWNRMKDKLGKGVHLSLTIRPHTDQVPQQAEAYRHTLGVVIEPGKQYREYPLAVDSPIFMEKGTSLYTGLEQTTQLAISWKQEPFHIIRSNVPFALHKLDHGWNVDLQADGMQQIKFFSPLPMTIEGSDLKVEENAEEHTYTITHFGPKTGITLQLK